MAYVILLAIFAAFLIVLVVLYKLERRSNRPSIVAVVSWAVAIAMMIALLNLALPPIR